MPKKVDKERKLVKSGKQHGRITDAGNEALVEATEIEEKAKKLEAEIAQKKQKQSKKAKKPAKTRGQRYLNARKLIDRQKTYPLSEAIKLLKKVSITSFNGSVDLHLLVQKTGLKGEVVFPHPTGKKQTIRIADEKLLKELEKGQIGFTTLVATPAIMPKLTKFAKVLGPKGLMPNPKMGTITDQPEEIVKKLAGRILYKTEEKAPLIHLTLGKIDSPEKELTENFHTLIEAIDQKNILKAVLAPSMGPGIKVSLSD